MQIKQLLKRLTGRATFPNIIVRGQSIGGSDDVYQLHREKQLQKVFEKAGVRVDYKESS
jgi:glutaredoxin 3